MKISDGLDWLQIYWVNGSSPKGSAYRYEVKSPPCAGWQHAFVLTGEKRSTIFCPFSFEAWTVSNTCVELQGAKEPKAFRPEWAAEHLKRKWVECQSFGWHRDYDVAALVLKKLGLPVPEQVMKGGEEDTRKKGGKEVAQALSKPVKASSKRGKFLKWFLEADGSRSVREAMAEFSMSRSNALSYLYMLKKDHGIGYELVGDMASIILPEGCDNPFEENVKQTAIKESPVHEAPVQTDPIDDDDDWLN